MHTLLALVLSSLVILPGCLYVAAAKLGLVALAHLTDEETPAEMFGEPPPDSAASVAAYQQCLDRARVERSVQCHQELAAVWSNCRARKERDPTVQCMQELTAIVTQARQPSP